MKSGYIIPATQNGSAQIGGAYIGLRGLIAAQLAQDRAAMLCAERDEIDAAGTIVPAGASAVGDRYLAAI
jgi:hypothetical protein